MEVGFVGDEDFVFAEGAGDFLGGGVDDMQDEVGRFEGALGAGDALALALLLPPSLLGARWA